MLLGKVTYGIIGRGFLLGQTFYCLPFIWDDKRRLATVTISKVRLLLWKLNILLAFAAAVVISYRFYFHWIQPPPSADDFETETETEGGNESAENIEYLQSIFIVGACWYNLFIHLCILFKYQDIPPLVGQFMKFQKDFEDEYHSRSKYKIRRREKDTVGLLLWNMLLNGIFVALFQNLYTGWNPDHFCKTFFTSQPHRQNAFGILWKLLILVINQIILAYIQASILSHCALLQLVFVPIMVIVVNVLGQLKFQPEERRYWTRSHLRYPNGFAKTYRTLTLLLQRTNSVTSCMVLVIQTNLNLLLGILLFLMVRVEVSILKVSAIGLTVANVFNYVTLSEYSGRIFEESKSILEERLYKNGVEQYCGRAPSKSVARSIASFTPLMIKIGPGSHYDGCTALSSLESILETTVSLSHPTPASPCHHFNKRKRVSLTRRVTHMPYPTRPTNPNDNIIHGQSLSTASST